MPDDPQMVAALALANRLWHAAGALSGELLGTELAQLIREGGPALHERLLYVFEYSELVLHADAPLFRVADAAPGA
jgi:hypothetical protein